MAAPAQSDPDLLRRQLREIYYIYRTSLLNKLYYADALHQCGRSDTFLNLSMAIVGTSSVASLGLWQYGWGHYVWAAITVFGGICGTLKQAFKMSDRLQHYTKLYAGHGGVYFDLKTVVTTIQTTHSITPELFQQYKQALARYMALAVEDDPKLSKKRQARCE